RGGGEGGGRGAGVGRGGEGAAGRPGGRGAAGPAPAGVEPQLEMIGGTERSRYAHVGAGAGTRVLEIGLLADEPPQGDLVEPARGARVDVVVQPLARDRDVARAHA